MMHPSIGNSIEKVESGKFDNILSQFDGNHIGVFINAYTSDCGVEPMPAGFHQSEDGLEIHISNEQSESAVQVGWFGESSSLCSNHPNCKDYKHKSPLVQYANRLDIKVATGLIEKNRSLLDELYKDGLGLFIVHGHNDEYSFTQLPNGIVAVIDDGVTTFRSRPDIVNKKSFIPTVWRFENGSRQVVGGFLA